MVKWKRLDPEVNRIDWASLLSTAKDCSPFQSYAWGEYKRRFGWEPERWVALNGSGRPTCCIQALKKRLPFNRVLVWVPGGPVVGFPESRADLTGEMVSGWLEQFRRENRLVYARFRSHQPYSAEATYSINRICARPTFKINSEYTIQIDLSRPLEELKSAMASKHRYYVKQSQVASIEWQFGHAEDLAQDMALLYEEMSRAKGIEHLKLDLTSLGALHREFDEDCLVLVGYHGEHPVTSCLILTLADKAFYLLAATGAQGRKISAAYAMVFKLFELLKSRGIIHFDFGGINPASPSAAGVNHFKRGFGGEIVEYLGEWEWATSEYLRWGANYLIKRKKNL